MKGTRLWSQPRSPLIQGRSRRERPFWSDWLVSFVLGAVAGAAAAVALLGSAPTTLVAGVESAALPVLAGAAGGAALGVPIASGFGWRPRWVAGALFAGAASVLAVWLVQSL